MAFVVCALVGLSSHADLAHADIQSKGLPVPSQADQAASEKLVQEVFATDLAKRLPADRALTAQKLFEQANLSTNDPVARFVLLGDARDIALSAGDVTTAWHAIEALLAGYQVDRNSMEAGALTSLLKSPTSPQASADATDYAIKLVDRLCEQNQYVDAQRVMTQAQALAARTRDTARQTSVRARDAEVRAQASEYDRMVAASETLRQSPADANANLTVGSFLCFVKNDWAAGLPRLAKGSDVDLKDAALADTAAPATAEGCKALGDKWWDAAEKKSGITKVAARRRAAAWYDKCLPTLAGLSQELVRKRIAEAGPHSPMATSGTINLLELIDASRDAVNGSWSNERGTLLAQGGGLVRLQIPYQPPEEYDLRIVYSYTTGSEGFMVMLPTPRGPFMTVNNSDSFYFETSRGSFGKVNHARIKRGESVRFLVKVRNDKIQAYLNAALISEFVPATRALGPSGDWKLRDPRCLGLGNWNTTLVFTTIELTEVRGTGTRTHQ